MPTYWIGSTTLRRKLNSIWQKECGFLLRQKKDVHMRGQYAETYWLLLLLTVFNLDKITGQTNVYFEELENSDYRYIMK